MERRMNAVTSMLAERPVDTLQLGTSQLGEITAAWQIMPETLMVFGWRHEPSAAEGTVAHQRQGAQRGRFRSVSWSSASAEAGAYHFISALQLPTGEPVRSGETLLLTGQGEPAGILARLPGRFLDAAAFGVELARLSGGSAVAITRFLTKMFPPAATRGNADIRSMLHAFLERASTPDGCVELAGAVEDHCAILQGWGAPPGPDCEVVLIGAAIERCLPKMAQFPRSDMRGTATGQVIVLPATATRDVAQIEAVVLLDRRGLRWRPMIKERRLLSTQDTVNHLRGVLPNFQCDAGTRAALQASLRPRFDGRFTLYDGGQPVRVAVDLAAGATGAGTYLTGWLYDPASVVAEVQLRGTHGGNVRLDGNWTRIVREDVTEAFLKDAALPRIEAGKHRHGFAIHVSTIGAAADGEAFYLDVSFRDGRCGFVPLTINAAGDAAIRARLLASVDLHKPSGMQIIEGHVAPFFARLTADGIKSEPMVVSPVPSTWSTAIVVPLADAMPPRALLSQFLRDPLGRGEGLVFVFGDNWTDAGAESLRTLAAFYGVPPALLRIEGTVTAAAALAAVASVAVVAKHLLLLDPGTVGRSRGWRPALHAALEASGGMACVSPTVVYEDESIRFGGTDAIERLDVTPYVHIRRRLAGMPVSLIAAVEPEPSITASLACCLMPRDAIRLIGPAIGLAATPSMQEADLFLRLLRNGVRSIWTPAAQVYAADRPSTDVSVNAARVGRMVDGWCLRARLAAEL
jgi:O-antigen biosynthesis protein